MTDLARLREFDEMATMSVVQDLFWEKGFEGTSYADLTKATGLGKGSLYSAFGNKQALYKRALETYIANELESLGDLLLNGLEDDLASWRDRLTRFLDTSIEAIEQRRDRRGCFICNAAIELAPFDPAIEKVVQDVFEKLKSALMMVLAPLKNEARAAKIAEQLLATYLGMRVMAKAGSTPKSLAAVRDSILVGI